jgi:hypothetical protein
MARSWYPSLSASGRVRGTSHTAGAGRKIHGAELPLAEGILDAGFEPPFLFFIAHLEPKFQKPDPTFHDIVSYRSLLRHDSVP